MTFRLHGHADDADQASVHERALESYVRASVNDPQWNQVRHAHDHDGPHCANDDVDVISYRVGGHVNAFR